MKKRELLYEKPIMTIIMLEDDIVTLSGKAEGTADSSTFEEIFGGKTYGAW